MGLQIQSFKTIMLKKEHVNLRMETVKFKEVKLLKSFSQTEFWLFCIIVETGVWWVL